MLTIVFRTVFLYFLLLLVIRLMGKRQIGELQTSEFIITVLLSEIASAPVTNPDKPLLTAVVPVLVLLILELSVSTALLHSNFLKRVFYGAPSVVIARGKIDIREMRKNRMEIDELLSELRLSGYSDPADVEYAILEDNGRLSVFPSAYKSPLTPEDMNLKKQESGIAHVCLLDGKILETNLSLAGWTRKQLCDELKSRDLTPADVFVLTVDDAGKVTCVKKEDASR
ncbi:MAG: DUF421 domain-containing protein [Clostridia bacterium]|nr:DUF421 domain-containing protein [Clostridia bacterium]